VCRSLLRIASVRVATQSPVKNPVRRENCPRQNLSVGEMGIFSTVRLRGIPQLAIISSMTATSAKVHDQLLCFDCGKKIRADEYRRHLTDEHGYSKRRADDSVARATWRHSVCRDCWNRRRPHTSSVGHEVPARFRVWDICCFCGKKHKSGLYARTNPSSHELVCG
jgi:hypothetical protein